MAKASRDKGARGELEVVHLLQPWWRQLEPEAVFSRTADQGRAPMDRRLHGDVLVQKAPRWPFHVEVKRNEGWNLRRWLDCAPSPVWGFWRQACVEARASGRSPMLWLRRNKEPWIVVVRRGRWPQRGAVPVLGVWGQAFVGSDPELEPAVAAWGSAVLTIPPALFAA